MGRTHFTDTDRLLLPQHLEQSPLFNSLSEDEAAFLLAVGERRAVGPARS